MRALAIAVLAAGLASCASPSAAPQEYYKTDDADAVPIYRSLIGRTAKAPACIRSAYDRDATNEAEVTAAISSFEVLLGELARAARAQRCEWTYEKPPAITDDYPITYALDAARTLVVRSRRSLAKGDTDASLQDLLVLARFGSDLMKDRWTIGKLTGLISLLFSQFELREHLVSGKLAPAQLERIEKSLGWLDRRYPEPIVYLRDERTMALELLGALRDLGFNEMIRRVSKEPERPKDSPPLLIVAWEAWARSTLRLDMDGVRTRIDRRWGEQLLPFEEDLRKPLNSGAVTSRMAALKDGNQELGQRMARDFALLPLGDGRSLDDLADLLFRLWLPAIDKVFRNHARGRVYLNINLLSYRLELHRLRTGHYPDRLDGFGPPIQDPFSGGTASYRRVVTADGEGFVLAVAGPDDDAERRMRILVDECRFDLDRLEEKGGKDADAFTMGLFRKRDSLH